MLKEKKKNLWLNNAQYEVSGKVYLPIKIEPEGVQDFYFEEDNFKEEMRKAVENKIFKKSNKLVVFAIDSLGEEHVCKTKVKIKSLI